MSDERCAVPRCRRLAGLRWIGLLICDEHYVDHCAGKLDLAAKLGVVRQPDGSVAVKRREN